MNHRILSLIAAGLLAAAGAARAQCSLIISEYIEGSSNNKAIELYNGTGASIDLAAGNYVLQIYVNASTTPGLTLSLTGTVAASATYVIANTSAGTGVTAAAQQIDHLQRSAGGVTANCADGDSAKSQRRQTEPAKRQRERDADVDRIHNYHRNGWRNRVAGAAQCGVVTMRAHVTVKSPESSPL